MRVKIEQHGIKFHFKRVENRSSPHGDKTGKAANDFYNALKNNAKASFLSKKRASDLLKALEIMLSTNQKPIVYGKNVISVEEGLWNT